MRNEEDDLRARFGSAFDEYAANVPLFLPHLFGSSYCHARRSQARQAFSWEQYRRNREYKALIGTLAGLVAVWLRMWLHRRYGY